MGSPVWEAVHSSALQPQDAGDGRQDAGPSVGAPAASNEDEDLGGAQRGDEPPRRPAGPPRSLLRRAMAPPASPRSRARSPLRGLVVVPRTPQLQAAEDDLSLALVALVLGNRPFVSPEMVRNHLLQFYGITEDRASVRRTRPDDFIVRFSSVVDLERVLTSATPAGAPFRLRWRRRSRLFMASAGAFRFKVLVGMKGIPAHAHSAEVAQAILGSSCARVELASPVAVQDPEDERELFVAAWCAHPDLIHDEMIMAVPEKEEDHDGGSPLYLRPHEIIHTEVPALRYLVRTRIVEFQDWHTPPPSSDDEDDIQRDDDSDSGDSNFNGYHPGEQPSGGGGRRPRNTRFGASGDPRLSNGWGPAFRAREAKSVIRVGDVACPVASVGGAPCRIFGSRIPAARLTGETCSPDMLAMRSAGGIGGSHPVISPVDDPMRMEAALSEGLPATPVAPEVCPHTVDILPHKRSPNLCFQGYSGRILDLEFESWVAPARQLNLGPLYGPESMPGFGPHRFDDNGSTVDRGLPVEVNLYLSGPEDLRSAPNSPRGAQEDGSLVVLPAPPMDEQAPAQPINVDTFIDSFRKPLEQPILLSPPRLRSTRLARSHNRTDEELVPKRSARLAAKYRHKEPRPEDQARKVMMRKFDIDVATEHPDTTTFEEFQVAFKLPLSPSKREAMGVLLSGRKQRGSHPVRAA